MDTRKYINKKKFINFLIYFFIMTLAFYTMFKGNNLKSVASSLSKMNLIYMIPGVITALFFVASEGMVMWYLFKSMNSCASFTSCIVYSFIGFFYSSITPSASGGQPMQLYYMQKDGNKLSESSVILMTVAVVYKFVLCLIGIAMLMFWNEPLHRYLGGFMKLYYLGLFLNVLLVSVLVFIMTKPVNARGMIVWIEKILMKLYILKKSESRHKKIDDFIEEYGEAVEFLKTHKMTIFNVTWFTFLQRISPYIITYLVYKGFSLNGAGMLTVMSLQAAIYVAVDMMPLPGAQGITELMYKHVFSGIFTGTLLTASLLAVRGLAYYMILVVSMIITMYYGVFKKNFEN